MKLHKKQETEVLKVYDTWLDSYLNGDVKTYDSYLDDDYRFIGSTNNEDFLNRKDTTKFFEETVDQLAGKAEIRNNKRTCEQFDEIVFITDLFDAYFLIENKWTYYGNFRFTSALIKKKEGWRFIYQHFSTPDSKAQDGETVGTELIAAENQQLRDAIKRRTVELEHKNSELELEASLERVRAVAMSMQKPDDILDVCKIISDQLEGLNISDIRNTQVAIINEEKRTYLNYQYFSPYSKLVFEETEYENHPTSHAMVSEMQGSVNSFFSGSMKGIKLKEFQDWRKKYNQYPDPLLDKCPTLHYYFYSIGQGGLGLTTYKEISKSELEIFKRFHKVFTLAYQRFKDIELALEQAKEAQIEAALERVRARTMGMQKSEELEEVIQLVYEQINQVNVFIEHAGFVIDYKERDDMYIWLADEHGAPSQVTVPYFDSVYWNRFNEAKTNGLDFFAANLTFEEKNHHYKELFKHIPDLSEEAKEFYFGCPGLAISTVLLKNVGLYIENFSGTLYTDEENNTLMRFGKVFQQTYTRFLDLQKAEAQTREAQIETALERVRSRSMAMQKSEELADLSQELVKQVQALGIDTWFCAFNIYDEDGKGSLEWGSNGQGTFPKYRTPREGVFLRYYEAGQSGETLLINEIDKNECPRHYEYLCSLPGVGEQLLKMKADGIPFPASQIDHTAFFKYGYILFITFEPAPKAHDIFKRFANVFEQTYTRFLDLKNAEEQSREAQIEAALEKVRSRSLAMQTADELGDVVNVIVEKLTDLDVVLDANGVVLCTYFQNSKDVLHWIASPDFSFVGSYLLPYFDHPIFNDAWQSRESGEEYFSKAYSIKEKNSFFEYAFEYSDYRHFPDDFKQWVFQNDKHILSFAWQKHSAILIPSHTGVVPSESDVAILKRFAKVFEQAYVRFMDLKKAEQQTRETQVELSLERIRARVTAMQESTDLLDIVVSMRTEFVSLGHEAHYFWYMRWLPEKYEKAMTSGDGTKIGMIMTLPRHIHGDIKHVADWEKSDEPTVVLAMDVETAVDYIHKMITLGDFTQVDPSAPSLDDIRHIGGLTFIMARTHHGEIGFSLPGTVPDPPQESLDTLARFAGVFDLAYRRFEDLKSAEKRNRETQIELALERSRNQSMLMQHSNELNKTSQVFHEQLELLGIESEFSYLWLPDEPKMEHLFWATWHENKKDGKKFKNKEVTYPLDKTEPSIAACYVAWESGERVHINPVAPDNVEDYFTTWGELLHGVEKFKPELFPDGIYYVDAYMKYGCFGIMINRLITEEEKKILSRFAIEFERAYTRFLDLQKAEAQAREAQIEAALERVRSKTMAMHNSEDMGNTVLTLFHEVLKLGLDNDIRCGIGILEGTERMETRSATLDSNGEVDLKMGMLDMTIHPLLKRIKKAWKSGETHFIDQMTGKDVIRYYTALNNEPDYPFFVDLDTLPETQFHNSFSFSEGILFAFSPNLMSEEATRVLDRFARVFGQTYRRFRDLQKAEEQTREAKIEASLERIRSQAMAMQHSDDLVKSTAILFEEFEKLKLSVDRCGIGIFEKETRDCHLWTTVTTHEGKTELATGITSLTVHPMLIETFKAWESQRSFQYILEGKELEDYYALVSKSEFHLPSEVVENSASLSKENYLFTPFGAGGLYVFSANEPAKEEKIIIRRFAEVFHLTYTRYEDLQKAEVRALEAVKQASLDRVRGEIASMRTTEDLQRITPLIWHELKTLDVPFIRCGVFIINETSSNVQVHLTTPDGKPIGALELPIEANDLTHKTVEHWRNKEVYTIHWNKEDFVNWMQSMINLGQIQTPEQYQGYSKPPESLDLHFIPFKQGMLYVGNTEPLLPEKIDLVNTLAEAFSIAYSRYEDFINLEEAKNKIENTLSDLKDTQTQLIHAEKMASLGELTAGIAHEIQNPLNFVNNFSEVNAELISELLEEIDNADLEEAKAVATDIAGNEEKIMHHGKRAEAIVKGMLQHSRASNTEKQETDINALADEYLRLSYHGLRAKDKSFNAGFKTNLEKDLPRVQVVSQDIGRVLLNLINNAFYAVSAKASAKTDPNYKSEVIVSTKKTDNLLEVCVSDNGSGIPADVKDKIFQPFFTTKPTGQGTGLGLSMSYDIITKGHGGKLIVETEEEKGTKFIIQIPV